MTNRDVKITSRTAKWLAFASCMTAATVVRAAVVYDETVNGDLPGYFVTTSLTLVPTQAGSNVIRGSDLMAFVLNDPSVVDAADGFRFVVPSGETARIELSGDIVGLQPGQNAARVWEISRQDPSCGPICALTFSYSIIEWAPGWLSDRVPPSDLWSAGALLGPGEYWVFDNYSFSDPSVSDLILTNWTSQIDVAPVPVPAAALLFVSALCGLGAASRRAS